MAEFDNRINKLREYMAEQKPEQYPLENDMLAEKDEYTKSLYLRMLCALIRYAGEPDEMQILYIRRLIAGIDAEQEYPDYMKMALDLSTDDVDEFVSAFADDELSYFFAIDGMILLAVANGAEKQYDLLAELVELIDIDREELTYLAAVAKSVVAQSSELFDEAKKLMPGSVRSLWLYHYIKNFYTGVVVDSARKYYVYSYNNAKVELTNAEFRDRDEVRLENISAVLHEDIVFDHCRIVMIDNCNLVGDKYHFVFNDVEEVFIDDCYVSDFTNRFAQFVNVDAISIRDNCFQQCSVSDPSTYYLYGGAIDISSSGNFKMQNLVIEDNVVKKNAVRADYTVGTVHSSGFFLNVGVPVLKFKLAGNRFLDCGRYNGGSSIFYGGGACIRYNYANSEQYKFEASDNECKNSSNLIGT